MPESRFDELRCRLIERGVAARFATRSARELEDHFEDLKGELEQDGFGSVRAAHEAMSMLGNLEGLIDAIAERPELTGWAYRYPRLGRAVLPVMYVALLPVGWVTSGAGYATLLARWGAISAISATITAAMFLAIQKSIMLG